MESGTFPLSTLLIKFLRHILDKLLIPGFGESVESFRVLDFDELNANGALAMLPAFALSLLIKKYMARGFTLGTTH